MKLKVKGITGMPPLILTRWQGYLDGKRGVFDGENLNVSYILKKKAICQAAVHEFFKELEEKTEKLYKESAALSIEYADIKRELADPDETAIGNTAGSIERKKTQVLARKPQLKSQNKALVKRLSEIDECIITEISQTVCCQREVCALTERRIHAYLHGISLALKKTPLYKKTEIEELDGEENFKKQHKKNDQIRQNILTEWMKGVSQGANLSEKEEKG